MRICKFSFNVFDLPLTPQWQHGPCFLMADRLRCCISRRTHNHHTLSIDTICQTTTISTYIEDEAAAHQFIYAGDGDQGWITGFPASREGGRVGDANFHSEQPEEN